MKDHLGLRLVKDNITFHKNYDNFIGVNLPNFASMGDYFTDSYFYVITFGLFCITVIEVVLTMRVAEETTNQKSNEYMEYLGTSITN